MFVPAIELCNFIKRFVLMVVHAFMHTFTSHHCIFSSLIAHLVILVHTQLLMVNN